MPSVSRCGGHVYRCWSLENKLLQFHFAQLMQTRHQRREMRRLFVCGQRLGVAPRLADHQHVRTRRTLENIVRYAAFVLERSGHQFFCHGEYFRTIGFGRADKNIQSYHDRIYLGRLVSFHGFDGLVVVRLLGNLRHQLGVHHPARLVDHHNGTRQQAGQRSVGHQHAVSPVESRCPEIRCGHDILDALGRAETGMRKRQVLRHGHNDGIGQRSGQLVEFAHRSRAYARIETWEDVQHDALAFQVAEFQRREIPLYQFEIGSLGAGPDEFAVDMHGRALEFCRCHRLFIFLSFHKT